MFLQYLRENPKQAQKNYSIPDFEVWRIAYREQNIALREHQFYAEMQSRKQAYVKELEALEAEPPQKFNLPENYKRRVFLKSEICLLNNRIDVCCSFIGIALHAEYNYPKDGFKAKYSLRLKKLPENFNDQKDKFVQYIYSYCDLKRLNEVELYKKAHISKQVFSNIRSMAVTDYVPSKPTVINLCLTLKLNLQETQNLLAMAGYTLSPILPIDVIIAWCIEHNEFDVDEVAAVLQELTGDAYLVNKLQK